MGLPDRQRRRDARGAFARLWERREAYDFLVGDRARPRVDAGPRLVSAGSRLAVRLAFGSRRARRQHALPPDAPRRAAAAAGARARRRVRAERDALRAGRARAPAHLRDAGAAPRPAHGPRLARPAPAGVRSRCAPPGRRSRPRGARDDVSGPHADRRRGADRPRRGLAPRRARTPRRPRPRGDGDAGRSGRRASSTTRASPGTSAATCSSATTPTTTRCSTGRSRRWLRARARVVDLDPRPLRALPVPEQPAPPRPPRTRERGARGPRASAAAARGRAARRTSATGSRDTFGAGIAELFLLPYNFKVWGYPLEQHGRRLDGRARAPCPTSSASSAACARGATTCRGDRTARSAFRSHGGTGAIWRGGRGAPARRARCATARASTSIDLDGAHGARSRTATRLPLRHARVLDAARPPVRAGEGRRRDDARAAAAAS